ncbi:MAG: TraE/TraK family type IV conjugative transfer system protein [Candidatus Tectimicrobiota bacterium]
MTRTPLDLWGTLQAKALRLEAAVVVLALATAGLTVLTVWQATRPLPIYYIPSTGGPGLALPGEVATTLVVDFAQQLLLLLANVTPQTVAAVHREVLKYCHPQFLTQFQAQAEREQALITAQQLSSQLSIREAVGTTTPPYRQVTISALRRVYVGKLPVRDEEVQAEVTLLPVRPSPLNPYGLVVTGLRLTPLGGTEDQARRP